MLLMTLQHGIVIHRIWMCLKVRLNSETVKIGPFKNFLLAIRYSIEGGGHALLPHVTDKIPQIINISLAFTGIFSPCNLC